MSILVDAAEQVVGQTVKRDGGIVSMGADRNLTPSRAAGAL